jgi:hypothetical protein
MIPPDLSSFRFAGFIITASRELHRVDRRVPRFVTAHRFLVENCVYSHEMDEPGHWDKFRLDRPLKEMIPARIRNRALQAVSDLAAGSNLYARPNVCMSREAVRAVLAAARVPRDTLQILEAGMRPSDANDVLEREDRFASMSGDKEAPHGIVSALRENRALSGAGTLLGVEPWYLDRRLRHSWRENHDNRAVRARAFSRLNQHGLLGDIIDFELFVPGLTPRRVHNRDARWVPLVLVDHPVDSVIGDLRARSVPLRKPGTRSS